MHLPTDPKERKAIPLYSGLIKYFPDALVAVAQLSHIGNKQHNPDSPLQWSREKSSDHHDTLTRHLFDAGTIDKDGVRHSAKIAWRALAALQLEIEKAKNAEPQISTDAKRQPILLGESKKFGGILRGIPVRYCVTNEYEG